MSFEHFCGFVGNDNSQWRPDLFRNTLTIHRWPMTRLDSFFHQCRICIAPGGLEDLS